MKKSTACAKKNNFSRVWLLLAALPLMVMLAGCVSGGRRILPETTADGPAMRLAQGLYERGESLNSLAARGGATYTGGRTRNYFKFEIAAAKPGKVRFTAFDPAGRPAFRLAVDGQTLTGIMYGAREYFSGPATAENFGRFLPLNLSPEELMQIMAGAQVRPAAAGARDIDDGRATELFVVPQGGELRLWLLRAQGGVNQDPASAVLESAAFGPILDPDIAIKYNAVKPVPREDLGGRPEPFPHSLEIAWRDEGQKKLRLTYDEIRLGLPVTDDLFKLTRPEGFELIQL